MVQPGDISLLRHALRAARPLLPALALRCAVQGLL